MGDIEQDFFAGVCLSPHVCNSNLYQWKEEKEQNVNKITFYFVWKTKVFTRVVAKRTWNMNVFLYIVFTMLY